jgi:hypothetical protein
MAQLPTTRTGWALLSALILIVVLGIWCFNLNGRVNRLEDHNRALVAWGDDVRRWSVSVSTAIWGPGSDPCCLPPKPPPELEQ